MYYMMESRHFFPPTPHLFFPLNPGFIPKIGKSTAGGLKAYPIKPEEGETISKHPQDKVANGEENAEIIGGI